MRQLVATVISDPGMKIKGSGLKISNSMRICAITHNRRVDN